MRPLRFSPLLFIAGLWVLPSHAEICSPPQRGGGPLQAPCYNSAAPNNSPGSIYGPWLDTCTGSYNSRFSSTLSDYMQDRVSELYLGVDRPWDSEVLNPPTSTFPAACNIADGEFRTNAAGGSCGPDLSPIDESSAGTRTVHLKSQGVSWAEKSYRYGAWIQALKYFQQQVTDEVTASGNLMVSDACSAQASKIQNDWNTLGPTAFNLQPNIAAVSRGNDPCIDPGQERLLYLQSYSQNNDPTASHIDLVTVKNRMSGCLMISARQRVETSFLQLAACEVWARAAAVDREFFIAGTACPASRTPNLSLYEQVIETRILKGSCETTAQSVCTSGTPAPCQSGAHFSLADDACWACVFQQVHDCYGRAMPQFLSSSNPGLPPAGDYPANLATLSIPNSPGLGISYRIDRDGCTDPTENTAGCPNVHAAMMGAGEDAALDGLNEMLQQATGDDESPLQSSLNMDSDQTVPFDPDRGTELPLDGVEPVLIFGAKPTQPNP